MEKHQLNVAGSLKACPELVLGKSIDKRRVHRLLIYLSIYLLMPLLSFGQECFDENGDCTLSSPVEFQTEVIVSCGDTLELLPSQEICNTWLLPDNLDFEYGAGVDSAKIFVVVNQCFEETLTVIGITNTPSGSGVASCNTNIVYTVVERMDTIQQGLLCGAFLALESDTEVFQSSCGCDSLLVEYFQIEIIDTTYLFNRSCIPEEAGIATTVLQASTGCDSILITTTELDVASELVLEDQQACEGASFVLAAFMEQEMSYLWSTGETTSFIEVNDPGTYYVTATDINGCTEMASALTFFTDIELELTASVAGPLLINLFPLEVWEGGAIQMDALVTGTPYEYEIIWNGGPEIGDSTLNFIAQESGELMVAAIDEQGCFGVETLDIIVRPKAAYVPSAFSPNEDRKNDFLNVYTTPNVEEVKLQLFSRRGNMVFNDVLHPAPDGQGLVWLGWNGFFNDELMLPQVFAYQLWFRSLRGEWEVKAGDVTLMR